MNRKLLSMMICILLAMTFIPLNMAYAGSGRLQEGVVEFDPDDWHSIENVETRKGILSFLRAADEYDPETAYGGQLTEQQKKIYDELVDYYTGANSLSNGVVSDFEYTPSYDITAETTDDLLKDMIYAYFAFHFDYPQVFWGGGVNLSYRAYGYGNYVKLYTATFTVAERYSGAKEKVTQFNAGVETALQQILEAVDTSQQDGYYKAVHDWMCDHMSYNYDTLSDGVTYAYGYSCGNVFAGDGSVVCDGYAQSFKLLCDQIRLRDYAEIYAAYIVGKTDSNENHAWNYACIDGGWYGVDVTWDDQSSGTYYDYYLSGSNTPGFTSSTFSQEHIEVNNGFLVDGSYAVEFPELQTEKWEPRVRVEVYSKDTGIDVGISGNLVVVHSSSVCRMGYLSGNSYLSLTAVAAEGEADCYYFTIPDDVAEVLLVVSGDINRDGRVDSADYGKLNAMIKGKGNSDAKMKFAADVNDDGSVTSADFTTLNAIILGNRSLSW